MGLGGHTWSGIYILDGSGNRPITVALPSYLGTNEMVRVDREAAGIMSRQLFIDSQDSPS